MPCPLKFVVPSYSENPNINAQKGVLTYWELHYKEKFFDSLSNHVDRTPIDQLIIQYGEEKGNIRVPLLYKIKVPMSYCL